MAEAKPVVLTNMCMIRDGEKVLVQIRNDKRWGGAVFPGGHIEDGESITDSVIREVFEETGLTVLSPVLCGVKNFYNDDGDTLYLLDQIKDDHDEIGKLSSLIALKESMKHLSDKEAQIINKRYYQGQTQTEIASELGISQAQVSRLEKSALERIKRQI